MNIYLFNIQNNKMSELYNKISIKVFQIVNASYHTISIARQHENILVNRFSMPFSKLKKKYPTYSLYEFVEKYVQLHQLITSFKKVSTTDIGSGKIFDESDEDELLVTFLNIFAIFDSDMDAISICAVNDILEKYQVLEKKLVTNLLNYNILHLVEYHNISAYIIKKFINKYSLPKQTLNFLLMGLAKTNIDTNDGKLILSAIDCIIDSHRNCGTSIYYDDKLELLLLSPNLIPKSVEKVINIFCELFASGEIEQTPIFFNSTLQILYLMNLPESFVEIMTICENLNIIPKVNFDYIKDLWKDELINEIFNKKIKLIDPERSTIVKYFIESLEHEKIISDNDTALFLTMDMLTLDYDYVKEHTAVLKLDKKVSVVFDCIKHYSTTCPGTLSHNKLITKLIYNLLNTLEHNNIEYHIEHPNDLFIIFNTEKSGITIFENKLHMIKTDVDLEKVFDLITYDILKKLEEAKEIYGITYKITSKLMDSIGSLQMPDSELIRVMEYILSKPMEYELNYTDNLMRSAIVNNKYKFVKKMIDANFDTKIPENELDILTRIMLVHILLDRSCKTNNLGKEHIGDIPENQFSHLMKIPIAELYDKVDLLELFK